MVGHRRDRCLLEAYLELIQRRPRLSQTDLPFTSYDSKFSHDFLKKARLVMLLMSSPLMLPDLVILSRYPAPAHRLELGSPWAIWEDRVNFIPRPHVHFEWTCILTSRV